MIYIYRSNLELTLNLSTAERYNTQIGNIAFQIASSDSIITRVGVFGIDAPTLGLSLSTTLESCKESQFIIPKVSFSPREIIGDITFSKDSYSEIFLSNKKVVEWYESDVFIEDTALSGGVVTGIQIPEENDNTVLPNYEFMSSAYPFVGYTRPRKIFAKNVSGFPLRYLHFGIEYPNSNIADATILALGTNSDTWGDALSTGWVGTGLILDNIDITDQYSITLEVEYKMYASFMHWEGQLCRITDRFGYHVFCVIEQVTEVDTYTSIIKISILEPLEKAFVAGEAFITGLATASDVSENEYVSVWMYNAIPFNAEETINHKIRLFAQGIV